MLSSGRSRGGQLPEQPGRRNERAVSDGRRRAEIRIYTVQTGEAGKLESCLCRLFFCAIVVRIMEGTSESVSLIEYDWQFTTVKARIKLKKLYPQMQVL